ncbi:cytochrome P450 [Gymnopus androsaceus JB14]|uniref:Cytochrome P450 n=1 Tax=Gymnopus androsaceus JB14 TaxID=1447944 RepID=A0A6A4HNZ0_9AGAR|nr:cytochrome P450 [Gymnopus androsaceus JB14]
MLSFTQQLAVVALAGVFVLHLVYKRWKKIGIDHVRGPEPQSWLLGNMAQYFQAEAGVADVNLTADYGGVIKLQGAFGMPVLLVADPKALQSIYNSGYKYEKHPIHRQLTKVILGGGLTIVEGDQHRIQRRVNTPAFGFPETRAHIPLFIEYASKLCQIWHSQVGKNEDSVVIDVNVTISSATMDVIGHAAFDYEFNALNPDGVSENPLKRALALITTKSFGAPSDKTIIFQNLLEYAPEWLVAFYVDHSSKFAFGRATRELGITIAKELVETKQEELRLGKEKRDIFSLLVKANHAADAKSRLSDKDLHSQMLTIIGAVATALSWSLYELGRQREIQKRLRNEVNAQLDTIRANGQTIFTSSDFEQMEYLTAFTKELLRFHPAVSWGWRTSMHDQVLPLSQPLTTTTGEVIDSLPIPKGISILTSIVGFNRNKEIFGQDADSFNPDRFLHSKIDNLGAPVGVYGNLLTFGGGTRACIVRPDVFYRILEYQSFLTEMIRNFEFEWVPETAKVRHENVLITVPVVEGQMDKGPRMPLRVRPVVNTEE